MTETVKTMLGPVRPVRCEHCSESFLLAPRALKALGELAQERLRRKSDPVMFERLKHELNALGAEIPRLALRCGTCGRTTCFWCATKCDVRDKGPYHHLALTAAGAYYYPGSSRDKGYFCLGCGSRLPSRSWWRFWLWG